MAKPIISIIVPMYNTERYLKDCVTSICRQTLDDFELILVDDGSTDNTLLLARQFAQNDTRIQVLSEEHKDAGHARNVGLAQARGEYLAILDSDDLFERDMLHNAYARAVHAGFPDIVLFKADRYLEYTNQYTEVPWMLSVRKYPNKLSFSPFEIEPNIFRAMVGWTWDKLFKRSFIDEHGICFQEQRAFNDLLFTFSAVVLSSRITLLDGKPLVHQRKRGGGSISDRKNDAWSCILPALLALRAVLIENNLYSRFERDFVNYALHLIDNNLSAIPASDPSFQEFYNSVRNTWHIELRLSEHGPDYYYVKSEWERYRQIINHDIASYYHYRISQQGKSSE